MPEPSRRRATVPQVTISTLYALWRFADAAPSATDGSIQGAGRGAEHRRRAAARGARPRRPWGREARYRVASTAGRPRRAALDLWLRDAPDGGTLRLRGDSISATISPPAGHRDGSRPCAETHLLPGWMSAREALQLAARLLDYERVQRHRPRSCSAAPAGAPARKRRSEDGTARRVDGRRSSESTLALAVALVGEPVLPLFDQLAARHLDVPGRLVHPR